MKYHSCYFNVDEVSSITLKKLLQSATELLQIATAYFITKCDRQLLQIATTFLLHCAMNLLQIPIGITKCDDHYKLRQYICPKSLIAWITIIS